MSNVSYSNGNGIPLINDGIPVLAQVEGNLSAPEETVPFNMNPSNSWYTSLMFTKGRNIASDIEYGQILVNVIGLCDKQ